MNNQSNAKRKRNQRARRKHEYTWNSIYSGLTDVVDSLERPRKIGWFYLFIMVFMVFFLGSHLFEAVSTLSVPNIKTTDSVLFGENPIWFMFVVIFKLAFFTFSLFYVFVFLKRRFRL